MLRLRSIGVLLVLALGCSDSTAPELIPDSVVIAPRSQALQLGDSAAFTASYLVSGTRLPSDSTLRWSSTDPLRFSIDSMTGHGRAWDTGTVFVIASSWGRSDTVTVTMIPSIDGLRLGVSDHVAAGAPMASVVYVHGNMSLGFSNRWYVPAPEAGAIAWRTSNPSVVAIDAAGRLTAGVAGTSWIVATLRGYSDSVAVAVDAGVVPELLARTQGLTLGDVNDSGLVAGYTGPSSSPSQAVLVSRSGSTTVSGCLPVDLNNAGQLACGPGYPAIYSNGVLTYPFGQVVGTASGITEAGVLFGLRGALNIVFWWSADGTSTRDYSSHADGAGKVNSSEHGLAQYGGNWQNGTILRTTGNTTLYSPGGRYSYALAITDADDVVGSGENMQALPGPGIIGLIWRASTKWEPEQTGIRASRATGISEADVVVGTSIHGPFVWRAGRQAILSELASERGWTFSGAPAISRNGTIAVAGTNSSGKSGIVLFPAGTAP